MFLFDLFICYIVFYVVFMIFFVASFFFFKQKTAYEMRISDWSSDVCSSDLKLVADAKHIGIAHLTCKRPADRTRRPEKLIAELAERAVLQSGLIFAFYG